ncbi:MAG: UDP-N-acetylmuramoyl-tripeptide--D-alanyl-D-alanine ligase [Eubacteriales bacterium]|nr:UDP-N-acetylmuramoyl-tripeptide--D-alanyl-D-alanine ligase [Eubacteriales bacterium]
MTQTPISFLYVMMKLVLLLLPVLCSFFAVKGLVHYFQLESYQFPGYFHTLRRNRIHSWAPGLCVSLACLAMNALISFQVSAFPSLNPANAAQAGGNDWLAAILLVLTLALSCFAGILIAKCFTEKKAKKPFVLTGRVKRFYTVFFLVMLVLSWLLSLTPWIIINILWPLLLPLVVALSGLLAWPVEKLISELYFRDARRKLLSNTGLIRIGITGSYGKTSVKHILGAILSEKYPTLITPASFNTPMGVTRAIREKLTPSYQVFVGEMGARHVGDIKEMCRLVHPTIGVITSVGPQHLETFKTIERVAKTKYELIDALPPTDSHSYFFDDGSFCTQMYRDTKKPKTLCGQNPGTADVWYTDVKLNKDGCTFTLHIRGKGSVDCHTRLLGEHSIHNILLATAVASDLGLSLKQIAHGIEKLQPVKNRLELMTNPGGFTIINDAFNSNPIGAKAALKVLAQFPKRRIIITPGMVELGEKEAEYNRAFGQQIAECVDIAIIVGKNRALPIIEGLRAAGFSEEHIYRVDSLAQSTETLHSLVTPDDTVLYENDLPDHYQEA